MARSRHLARQQTHESVKVKTDGYEDLGDYKYWNYTPCSQVNLDTIEHHPEPGEALSRPP